MSRTNPGAYRRSGYLAFVPGEAQADFNPYLKLTSGPMWMQQQRAGYWREGWEKAAKEYRPPRITVREAAQALIDDVRRRHPGEELRCPLMIALDDALGQEP